MSLTAAVEVPAADREVLLGWTRAASVRAGLAQRARIVLLAADAVGTGEIVRRVGVSKPTVIGWRRRYQSEGLARLDDRPNRAPAGDQRGADRGADAAGAPGAARGDALVEPAARRRLGLSNVTIANVWRKWNLQPRRTETFTFSTDPELDAKVRDVVGLYLNPPKTAVVLCVDEKSQVQALDRTAPILPLRPGLPHKQTHDYRRHETTSLFAALEVETERAGVAGQAPPGCSCTSRPPRGPG